MWNEGPAGVFGTKVLDGFWGAAQRVARDSRRSWHEVLPAIRINVSMKSSIFDRDITQRLGYAVSMGSKTFECVHFSVYSNDHSPRHVHALLGETRVIIDLLQSGNVQLADRERPFTPLNAKRSDLKKALQLAAKYFDELVELWENTHGKA